MQVYLSRNITTLFMVLELLLSIGVGLYLSLEAQHLALKMLGGAILLILSALLAMVAKTVHDHRRFMRQRAADMDSDLDSDGYGDPDD